MNDLDMEVLRNKFNLLDIDTAIGIAKSFAHKYPPSYYTGHEDFSPHTWVVAAIAHVVASKVGR